MKRMLTYALLVAMVPWVFFTASLLLLAGLPPEAAWVKVPSVVVTFVALVVVTVATALRVALRAHRP